MAAAVNTAARIQVLHTVLHMQALAAHLGLNSTDLQCLNLLSLNGSMTPSRLAEAMTISKGGATTAMVDRLEKAGYVRRTRDPRDRRQVHIEIVDGEPFRRLAQHFQPFADTLTNLLASYTDDQIALILEFTTRSNDAIRHLRPGSPTSYAG